MLEKEQCNCECEEDIMLQDYIKTDSETIGEDEIDASIFDTISLFNQKGLSTLFSCGGHFYLPKERDKSKTYILAYDTPYLVFGGDNYDDKLLADISMKMIDIISRFKLNMELEYRHYINQYNNIYRAICLSYCIEYYAVIDEFINENPDRISRSENNKYTLLDLDIIEEIHNGITDRFRTDLEIIAENIQL